MANVNIVILMGNLTRDPQLKYLPSQTAVADFGLAVSRKFKTAAGEDKEEVLFIDCSAFGKTAETINQYCRKGKALFIEGRLKLDTWDDKQTGQKRSKHAVIVDKFQFVGPREGGGGAAPGADYEQRPQQRQAPQRAPAQQPEQPFSDEQQFKEEDIPF
jgi:single-strand DNA-binding protein